jgi:hypothetical protein
MKASTWEELIDVCGEASEFLCEPLSGKLTAAAEKFLVEYAHELSMKQQDENAVSNKSAVTAALAGKYGTRGEPMRLTASTSACRRQENI